MSQFKINSITNKEGTFGPVISGVSTNNSTGCMIIPAGDTNHRNIPEGVTTDGLVGYYDAGNTESYSGSGTTWFDLSDNSNHATISGSTFNSNFGGYFANDGSNDLITVPYQRNPMRVDQFFGHLQITYDVFIRIPSSESYADFMGVSSSGGQGSGGLYYGETNQSNYYQQSIVGKATDKTITFKSTPTDPGSDYRFGAHLNADIDDTWVHLVASMDLTGGNGFNNSEFYQNGEKLELKFINRSVPDFRPVESYNQDQVDNLAGGRYVNSQAYHETDVAIIKLYDRVLSQDEVASNFNAHRGRFGI